MEKLTEYVDGKYIRIKGTKSLYPKNERDGAPLSNAIARLAAYEETGLSPEEIERILDSYGRGMTLRTENAQRLEIIKEIPINRLRELAQAEKAGQLAKFPFIAMVEQSLRDGTMKPMSDQKHNGRYAVVYKSERWTSPLIDICGTPYNTEQAVERMREISREAAEAAQCGGDCDDRVDKN